MDRQKQRACSRDQMKERNVEKQEMKEKENDAISSMPTKGKHEEKDNAKEERTDYGKKKRVGRRERHTDIERSRSGRIRHDTNEETYGGARM